MARVKMIAPEEANAVARRVYDGVVRQWGRISNFSKVLAHQPAALEGWMLPNEAIRLGNLKSDPGLREDPAARDHQDVGAQPKRLLHVTQCAVGKKIGLTDAQIKAAQGSDYMALDGPRRPAEGGDPLGRSGHADAGARRR